MKGGRYGDFNVLDYKNDWDHHTQKIVLKRTEKPSPLNFFNQDESAILVAVLRHLLYEHREEILSYVIAEMDQQLSNPYGEAQRDPKTPPQAELVRRGLAALKQTAMNEENVDFPRLSPHKQLQVLSALQLGQLPAAEAWAGIPQKQFFKKILSLAVGTYYSHPTIWSEIGYAGPVYPRSYVRIELGLTDPWEARKR